MAGFDLGLAPGARATWREFSYAPDVGSGAREKRDLYERHGVREYWRIDVDTRTITIDRDSPLTFTGSSLLTTPHPPGFEVSVPRRFDLPLPAATR